MQRGVLRTCELSGESETEGFVNLAGQLDDGEAKSLAIALARDMPVVTDDRKSRRIFVEMGGAPENLLSTMDLIKTWSEEAAVGESEIRTILTRVEVRSRFVPRKSDPHYEWWGQNCSAGD